MHILNAQNGDDLELNNFAKLVFFKQVILYVFVDFRKINFVNELQVRPFK